MVTTSLSLVSNEDMSYFPSVQLSLVMTMVMLISTFTPTVHVNKKTPQLDTLHIRLHIMINISFPANTKVNTIIWNKNRD